MGIRTSKSPNFKNLKNLVTEYIHRIKGYIYMYVFLEKKGYIYMYVSVLTWEYSFRWVIVCERGL